MEEKDWGEGREGKKPKEISNTRDQITTGKKAPGKREEVQGGSSGGGGQGGGGTR